MVALILRDSLKKSIQGSGHLLHFNTLLLGLIFLFKDKSTQVRAQNLYSWFVELVSEDLWIQISLILDKFSTSSKSSRTDYLRHLENQLIVFFEMLLVFFQSKVVWGRFPVLIQEWSVKGIINFQDGKMLKIFFNALYR